MTEFKTTHEDAVIGDQFRPADHLDHLVAFLQPITEERDIDTAHGRTDAVKVATVHSITTGETFEDVLIFPMVLRSVLLGSKGRNVLGRIAKGTAKPGRSAPYVLDDATEADVEEAQCFLAQLEQTATSGSNGGRTALDDEEPFVMLADVRDIEAVNARQRSI